MSFYKKIIMDDNYDLIFCTDLHGNYTQFFEALEEKGVYTDTQIVCAGDLIDRGNENIPLLLSFLEYENYYFSMGNHEDALIKASNSIDYLKYWLTIGGQSTYNNFGKSGIDYIATQLLNKIPIVLEIHHRGKTFGVIHSGIQQDDFDIINDWNEFVKLINNNETFRNSSLWNSSYSIFKNLTYFLENNYKKNKSKNEKNNLMTINKDHPYIKNIDFVISGHFSTNEVVQINNNFWIDTYQNKKEFSFLKMDENNKNLIKF